MSRKTDRSSTASTLKSQIDETNSTASTSASGSASASATTTEIPAINEEVIQNLIHQKLDEVRSGDLYVSHGIKDDSIHSLRHDPTIYKKFESMLAKTWMDIELIASTSQDSTGLNGGKLNRKKKLYTKALRSSNDFVMRHIENYITNHSCTGKDRDSTPSTATSTGTGTGKKKKKMRSTIVPKEEEEDEGDCEQGLSSAKGTTHTPTPTATSHHSHHNDGDHSSRSQQQQQQQQLYVHPPPDSNDDDDDNDDPHHHHPFASEEDTVSSLSDGKVSRSSSSQKRKKKRKHKKRKHKEKKKSKKSKKRKRHKSSSSSKSQDEQEEIMEQESDDLQDMDEDEMDEDNMDMDMDMDMDADIDDEEGREMTPREKKRHLRRIEKAKVLFEQERSEILNQLSDKAKREFRTIGFAKWGKDYLPVMQLGPYDVPSGNVRDQWMTMFENTKKKGRQMSKLVLWYGLPRDDLSSSFSFIASSKFIPYEETKKKKLDVLPAKLQKKMDMNKKLTSNDLTLVNGIEEWRADAKLPPDQRAAWLQQGEDNEYEDFLDQVEDDASEEEEEDIEQPDEEEEERDRLLREEQAQSVVNEKKRKKKKKKQAAAASVSENHHDVEPEKKSKKRKRDKNHSSSAAAASAAVSTTKSTKKAKKSKSLDEEIEEEVAEEDAIIEEMQEDPPSEDDEDDGDFHDGEVSDESESEEDELYHEKASRPKQSTKKGKKALKAKAKQTESKPKSKTKVKKATTTTTATKSSQPPSEYVREQERFEECEKIFLPLMSMLKEVYSVTKAEKLIRKIDKHVQKLIPSFIRAHQIGIAVKEVRAQFKDSAEINQLCKQLTSKMKKVFHAKLESEPKDFVPKVKKSTKKQEKTEMESNRVKSPTIDERETVVRDSIGNSIKSEKSTSSPVAAAPVTIEELSIPQKAQKIPPSEEVQKIPAQPIPIADEDMKEIKKEKILPNKKIVKTPRADKPKPARKSFSLAGMFGRNSAAAAATPTPTNSSKIEKEVELDSPSHNRVEVQDERPKWIVNYQPTGPNIYENDPYRSFAMEFLMEAVRCFPEGKVDPMSVARALEEALHTKYDGDHEKYMERVHDVCAAIAGKKQLGSVAQKIISGDYTTPFDVINIPRKLLFQSFEGFWIP